MTASSCATAASRTSPSVFAVLRIIGRGDLLGELKNAAVADYVRRTSLQPHGRYLRIFTALHIGISDIERFLVAETLAYALAQGCVHALFMPVAGGGEPGVVQALERQGFVRTQPEGAPFALYETDMRSAVVLLQNLETTIKEPFCDNLRVLDVIDCAHRRLQEVVTRLYPGSLVLSLSAQIIHQRLLKKITDCNQVDITPSVPRRLGSAMCVPFGKLLRGKAVPNTVTKTLHTDKVYAPDIKSSTVEAFPYYSTIENQVRTIKSFSRPVILVDDLMDTGNRWSVLGPLLKKEGIEIRAVLLGILSGYGRDLMVEQNVPVDCVYFIPNLRNWFVESTYYPFIGATRAARKGHGLEPLAVDKYDFTICHARMGRSRRFAAGGV
jgi:hypothetical protein